MSASTYDPTGQGSDAFNIQNMVDPSVAPAPVGTDARVYLNAEKTKLAGVQAGATDDQSAAEIKIAYESNADTNAFLDAEKTKLTGIENNATADQTGAEIKVAYEAELDTNAYTDAEKTKLGTVETGAKDDQNAAEVPFTPTAPLTGTNVQAALDEAGTPQLRYQSQVVGTTVDPTRDNVAYAVIPEMTITFTPDSATNVVKVNFNGEFEGVDKEEATDIAIFLDGAEIPAVTRAISPKTGRPVSISVNFTGTLTTVSHTIDARWKTAGDSDGIQANGIRRHLYVEEWLQ